METIKPYNIMIEKERIEYLDKVKTWHGNTYSELCNYSDAWTATQIKSFEEGLQLLSAFSWARQFLLDSALHKDYQRRMSLMNSYMNKIRKDTGLEQMAIRPSNDKTEYFAAPAGPADKSRTKTKKENAADLEKIATEMLGERPKHIDEYKHLLSPDMQARVDDIATLRASVARHAEMAKELARNNAKKEAIAEHSEKAVKYQSELKDIYAAIDAEIEALKEKPADATKKKATGSANPSREEQPVKEEKASEEEKEDEENDQTPEE